MRDCSCFMATLWCGSQRGGRTQWARSGPPRWEPPTKNTRGHEARTVQSRALEYFVLSSARDLVFLAHLRSQIARSERGDQRGTENPRNRRIEIDEENEPKFPDKL